MRKPDWLRVRLPAGEAFAATNERLNRYRLHSVCTQARCPNLAECWARGTATFLILGDTCTRYCRFCAVKTGNPRGAVDEGEPARVAAAVRELGLAYVVLTSVDRDDLPDLGAAIFAETVRRLNELRGHDPESKDGFPGTGGLVSGHVPVRVEVLVPDFGGRAEFIGLVLAAGPVVYGHNLETVERLSPAVRDPRASYRGSLDVLATARRLASDVIVKSSLLLGLGETRAEVSVALADLRSAGCDSLAAGQYLQPNRRCLPVQRYWTPDEFAELAAEARSLGFSSVRCGPLVRSSYRAEEEARDSMIRGAECGN